MNIITKIVLMMLIVSTLVLSGCIDNEQKPAEENETLTPEKELIEEEAVSDEVTEEPPAAPENDKEDSSITTTLSARQPYTQQMNIWKYAITPLDATIYVGDSVQWFNNEAVTRNGVTVAVDEPYTLTSAEGLWEPVRLRYANKFVYMFNESGIYHYYMPGYPSMNGTITVFEHNETTEGLYTSSSLSRGLIKVVPGELLNATFVPKHLLNVSAGERVSGGIREAFPITPNRLIEVS